MKLDRTSLFVAQVIDKKEKFPIIPLSGKALYERLV
jgi:hypothetical protein